jgi:hypothetical protein
MIIVVVVPLLVICGVVGAMLLATSARRGHAHAQCGNCRYDLVGSVGVVDRCPECGSRFLDAGIIPPAGRQRPILAVLGAVLLLAATFVALVIFADFQEVDVPAVQAIPQPGAAAPPTRP